MDNLTHTLFALTLARTSLGRAGRGATAALVIASNAPDIDVVTLAAGTASYLRWHRGPTHGLLGILLLGALSGVIVWAGCRARARRSTDPPDARLGALIGMSMLAALGHVLMDLPTSYGTRLLSPFDWHWFAVDWMPIVDVYLLVSLAAGLLYGRTSPEARRRNVVLAFLLMGTIYSVRAFAHHRALDLAPRLFGETLPLACGPGSPGPPLVDYWPRPAVAPPPGGKRCLLEMAAMPGFVSPFEWRVIARMSNGYEMHDVNILDARFLFAPRASEVLWRTTVHVPNVWTPAVFQAATAATAQTFLAFSRFPAARTNADSGGGTTVRWTDVRVRTPFAIDVRVAADGRVLQETLTR